MGFRHSGIALHSYSKCVDIERPKTPKEWGELLSDSLFVRRSSGQGNLGRETREEERGAGRTQGEQLGEVARSLGANIFLDDGAGVIMVTMP